MKLSLTPRAADDLDAIASYLLERNPAGARSVGLAIDRSLLLLCEQPLSGRLTRKAAHIRRKVVPKYQYSIFYRITADVVEILHIRHGARRPWRAAAP